MNKKKINYRIWPLGKLDKKFQRTEIYSLKKKGYKFKDIKTGKEIVKADTPEYAEYAKLYEPLDAAKKKLTSLKAKLEDIRDPEKAQAKKEKRRQQDAERRATKKDTPPISESKIRIKIKR